MSEQWTPTTDQVRSFYAHDSEDEYHDPIAYPSHVRSAEQAFDRWLAQVQREAAVKALREVADAAQVVHEAGYRCPRVITTLEELEALQDQAVILSTDLEVLICVGKTGSNLWADAWGTWIESVLVTLPARVFWDPTP